MDFSKKNSVPTNLAMDTAVALVPTGTVEITITSLSCKEEVFITQLTTALDLIF